VPDNPTNPILDYAVLNAQTNMVLRYYKQDSVSEGVCDFHSQYILSGTHCLKRIDTKIRVEPIFYQSIRNHRSILIETQKKIGLQVLSIYGTKHGKIRVVKKPV